jgi:hypothetical protein
MTTVPMLALAAVSTPEILVTPSPGYVAATGTAWGSCEIGLLANRVASLRTGSTHKVYRDWRFMVGMSQGHPRPGTALFTVPVDAVLLAKGQTRYAMVQLANQGAIDVSEPAAFSWSATFVGTTDPLGEALALLHLQLTSAGWAQDAMVPTRFTKPDPTGHLREEPQMATSDVAAHIVASGAATARLTAASNHLTLATPPDREMTGLDAWETDGGTRAMQRPPIARRSKAIPGQRGTCRRGAG